MFHGRGSSGQSRNPRSSTLGPGHGMGSEDAVAPPPKKVLGALRARLAPISPWGPPLVAADLTKAQRRIPAVAGTLAATTALLALLILRFQGFGSFLPETAVEWVVDHIPGALEATAIGLMGGFA